MVLTIEKNYEFGLYTHLHCENIANKEEVLSTEGNELGIE
jgi:hypothetical protein